MGVDRIGNRVSKGQAAGVYGTGFIAGFLTMVGPRVVEVQRMVEGGGGRRTRLGMEGSDIRMW